jgi:hypothetical protein
MERRDVNNPGNTGEKQETAQQVVPPDRPKSGLPVSFMLDILKCEGLNGAIERKIRRCNSRNT